jgi:hypothetical protein
MTNNEFTKGMKVLVSNFSLKKLTESQYDLICNRFSYLPDGRFDRLVDHLIDNYSKKDFDFSIKAFKNALIELPTPQSSSEECSKCNYGCISYDKIINSKTYRYASRCDCEAGESLSRQIPRHRDIFSEAYQYE